MRAEIARRWATVPGPVRGALWMSGSTASWAVMAALIRLVTEEIHAFEVVFLRSLFGAMFLLPWLFGTGIRGIYTKRVGMHLLRGLFGLTAAYLIFYAISIAPLGEIAAIITTRPIFASAAAILVLHEAAHGRRWSATILGFIGALIILRPGMVEISLGALLAMFSVFAMAAVSIIMKSLSRTESPDAMAMWQVVVFTPVSLVPAIFVWTWPSLTVLLLCVLIGFFGTLTQRILARAYKAADATVILPFEFTRLIFSALIGFLFFAEIPEIWVWIGGAVILVGTVAMARKEAKAESA